MYHCIDLDARSAFCSPGVGIFIDTRKMLSLHCNQENGIDMKANTKEWIQYGSAITMLLSGILLSFFCFFLNHYKIDDSVLWYVAQALVYAGSIFGVSVYIRSKMGDVKNDIVNAIKTEKEEKHHEKD